MLIDSASNKKIKLMESLRLRKHRAKEGLFRIEGVRLSEMAAASGWAIRFGLYTAELVEKERGRALVEALQALEHMGEVAEHEGGEDVACAKRRARIGSAGQHRLEHKIRSRRTEREVGMGIDVHNVERRAQLAALHARQPEIQRLVVRVKDHPRHGT